MNIRPNPGARRIDAFCRAYAALLHLYPRAHRERWGGPMRQTFRDRCIQASRNEGPGLNRWLLATALPDLLATAARERIAAVLDSLQGEPMRKFGLIILGIILEVVGSGLLAIAVIGLWYAVSSGHFARPGPFDSLMALQIAFGLAGAALLAIGIRQLQSAVIARPM